MTPGQAAEVLAIWERAEACEGVFWHVSEEQRPGEFFLWEMADLASITPEEMPAIRRAMAEGGALRITDGEGAATGLMLRVRPPEREA